MRTTRLLSDDGLWTFYFHRAKSLVAVTVVIPVVYSSRRKFIFVSGKYPLPAAVTNNTVRMIFTSWTGRRKKIVWPCEIKTKNHVSRRGFAIWQLLNDTIRTYCSIIRISKATRADSTVVCPSSVYTLRVRPNLRTHRRTREKNRIRPDRPCRNHWT